MPDSEIKIVLTDDHPMMLEGLQYVLSKHPLLHVIGTYSNGEELLAAMETGLIADVLLLDIQMPGKRGDELLAQLLHRWPDLRVLIVTNFDSALYANNAMKQGAYGYVLKTAAEDLLIKSIKDIAAGIKFIEPAMQEKMAKMDDKIRNATTKRSTLTPRETDVLRLLAEGLTSQEISQQLFLSVGTIENYRGRLLLKLDVKNNVALVKKALQFGLIE